MLKTMLTAFMFPLLLLFYSTVIGSNHTEKSAASQSMSGTLQKMIAENASITMDLDLNGLNGNGSLVARPVSLHFAVAANSFFSILVFNDLLRGPEAGSMALVPQNVMALPSTLGASINQLVVEKLPSDERFDLAVRDAKTGFTFFNIVGHQYGYDAKGQLLTIQGGRLLISNEFADVLGQPSDAGMAVGKVSVAAKMQAIEVQTLVNGEIKSVVMPALHRPSVGTIPGPDVIVGDLPDMQQFGSAGTQVGAAIATTSCNKGTIDLDWFALPQIDHPVIPQNFYRMSGGPNNNDRFEQIGQSWLKHAFTALTQNACGFGCNGVGGSHLGSGCSDPYSSNLNGGQTGIGSRAWVNPFTGAFPSTANNHTGHAHDGVSHRVRMEVSDLNQNLNQGAIYFAEAQYVTPHEYMWCQQNSGQCNMYNNVSYRQFTVTGTTSFVFSPAAPTVREKPAILAWQGEGATVGLVEPDPGNDGIWFLGYKVTNPSAGVWHYEYALYNENLDRGIQSFSVPHAPGVIISNFAFHAPPQEPGWANDGTSNNQGYSSMPWTVTLASDSITWNSETILQNPNANAIRWGTLYNFRFDADQPPQNANATVGYFKTGSPSTVLIQAPSGGASPTPTPTSTPTATPTATAAATATATATSTATATATSTATATATATAIATATATPTSTPRPSPTPRSSPAPRVRPTPAPRP